MIVDSINPGAVYSLTQIEEMTAFTVKELRRAVQNGEMPAEKIKSNHHTMYLIKGADLIPWLRKANAAQWDTQLDVRILVPNLNYTDDEIAQAFHLTKAGITRIIKSGEMRMHQVLQGKHRGEQMISGADALEWNKKKYQRPVKILPNERYTVNELATLLNLGATTVYAASERGVLSGQYAYKHGQMQITYLGQEVIDWRSK